MKMEFNWVKHVKVTDIVEINPDDPKKAFHQRKILIATGNDNYTLILNGSYESNVQLQINVADPELNKPKSDLTKQKKIPASIPKKTSKS